MSFLIPVCFYRIYYLQLTGTLKKLKLDRLLSLLSSVERKEFQQLLRTTLLGASAREQKFCTAWMALPESRRGQKDREKVFKKIYPGEAYDDLKLRRHQSSLTGKLERYLAFKEIDANEYHQRELLLSAYERRDDYDLFLKTKKDLLRQLDKVQPRTSAYFDRKLQVLYRYFDHPRTNREDPNDPTVDQLMETLDQSFALHKLRFAMMQRSREMAYRSDPQPIRFLGTLVEELEGPWARKEPIIQIYRLASRFQSGADEVDFKQYETELFAHFEFLSHRDRMDLFLVGLNFLVREARTDIRWYKDALRWYKFGLNQNLFVGNGHFITLTFINIVIAAATVDDHDWGRTFVDTYREQLASEDYDRVYHYAMGVLSFFERDYTTAIDQLSVVEYQGLLDLPARSYLARAYFKLYRSDRTYHQVVISYLVSYEQYLLRNKTWPVNKIWPNLNLCRLLQRTVRRLESWDDENRVKIWYLQEVAQTESLLNRTWLLNNF